MSADDQGQKPEEQSGTMLWGDLAFETRRDALVVSERVQIEYEDDMRISCERMIVSDDVTLEQVAKERADGMAALQFHKIAHEYVEIAARNVSFLRARPKDSEDKSLGGYLVSAAFLYNGEVIILTATYDEGDMTSTAEHLVYEIVRTTKVSE